MSASQTAAQAAFMQHQNQQAQLQGQAQSQRQAQLQQQAQQQHARQRSQTVPPGGSEHEPTSLSSKRGSGPLSPPMLSLTEASGPRENAFGGASYHNGLPGNHSLAATAAANVVFPRSGQSSPRLPSSQAAPPPPPPPPPKPEKSKVKLFSRPGKIGVKTDAKDKPLPSPGKIGQALSNLQRGNFSTTSLDSTAQSFYTLGNSSAATIRPMDAPPLPMEKEVKEKEKKHHFLSRQKHKLKEDYHLPLSSASSNSKPTDPNAPSSLYSFNLPASPAAPTSGFKSGLDLRHGGRALRDKKKEEKAFDDTASSYNPGGDWAGPSSVNSGSQLAATLLSEPIDGGKYGLNSMNYDDAWPFLKAKLLVIFEAEDLRLPVEDLNRVVTMHLQFCIARRSPNIVLEDLRDLLATGFSSLDQTLRRSPEDRLIPSLVELWIFTFTIILPYLQAVFLPLDLEFAGNGPLMTPEQARDFWGGIVEITPITRSPVQTAASLAGGHQNQTNISVSPASSVLDVRRIVLLAFRDIVILPRYETLKAMFSRLSLEFLPQSLASMALASPIPVPSPGLHTQNSFQSMQLSTSPGAESQHSLMGISGSSAPVGPRPGTAMSLDPASASYNSTGTTLLGDNAGSGGNRSRAISNVSFGSDNTNNNSSNNNNPMTRPFTPSSLNALSGSAPAMSGIAAAAAAAANLATNVPPTHTAPSISGNSIHSNAGSGSLREQNVEDSKQVTEMVGRMLQCMSVLASVGGSSHGSSGPAGASATNISSSSSSMMSGIHGSIGSGNSSSGGDEGNRMIEELNKLLKLNWLGRGRTGRNRRGLVGGRVKRGVPPTMTAESVREEVGA